MMILSCLDTRVGVRSLTERDGDATACRELRFASIMAPIYMTVARLSFVLLYFYGSHDDCPVEAR
jgi:hypothetical protein